MSTRRYSGVVSARITYVDAKATYRVYLDTPSTLPRKGTTVWVGEPRVLTRAVDSPDAFDDAFRAAVGFAGLLDEVDFASDNVAVFRSERARGAFAMDNRRAAYPYGRGDL